MPETTVNEDDGFVFRQNNIWFTRKVFIVKCVSETLCMQKFSYKHFRLCILCLYPAHVIAAGLLIMYISHYYHASAFGGQAICHAVKLMGLYSDTLKKTVTLYYE